VITACPGNRVCKRGQKDTQRFAKKIDNKFFGIELPHKFKITVSGCPNACTKPRENDIGFNGMVEPEIFSEDCIECGKCQKLRKEKAIIIKGGLPSIDPEKCVFCGDCILGCPTGSLKAKRTGYAVYAGGKMGRHPLLGQLIADFVSEKEGLSIVKRLLDLYQLYGAPKERFGDTIQRIDFDQYVCELFHNYNGVI
jgi:dissimilatory sulfite reductase (desulfoviridin) alpha/beta subunit